MLGWDDCVGVVLHDRALIENAKGNAGDLHESFTFSINLLQCNFTNPIVVLIAY